MKEEQKICDKLKQEPGVHMYKVVIVDDEPIIAEGLSKVVPWEKYGCKIAATAGNGQEGLEVIRKEQPNIVISDISMPGMDGLKMIAALRVEFPEMQISILTGYRDFDYAQQAIRLGVTRFLLKPSNMDEIEEAVQVMAENLKKRNITGEEDESENTAGSFIVKNALAYIQENYNKKISLSEVAENTFVSQWHLSKPFEQASGKELFGDPQFHPDRQGQGAFKGPVPAYRGCGGGSGISGYGAFLQGL